MPGAKQARAAKVHLVRAEQSPGIWFTGGNPKLFPPKKQIRSCWASTKGRPPEPPSTAKSRAHGGGVHVFVLHHLGELKLPYGCSSKSLTILTQMGGIFPDLQPQQKGPSRAKMLCGWSESVPGPLCPLRSRRDIVLVQPIRNTNHWHQNLTLECRLNQKRLCSTKKNKTKHTTHNNKNNTQKIPFCSGLSCIFLHLLI